MCGIAGALVREGHIGEAPLADIVRPMARTLVHRGPDGEGIWVDDDCGVGLGFRRLAILDLTHTGDQPMSSRCSRYVVVFNGEIYNHHELRAELATVGFRGRSDTEVLLAACTRWGVDGALPRLNGMFSFALWDREARRLTLARDRFGEKPMYYGWVGNLFLFGSELKALRVAPSFRPRIDRDALTLFLRHGYIPAPHTVYQGIAKLSPGTALHVRACGAGTPEPYWSAGAMARAGLGHPFDGSEDEALDALDAGLRTAVALRSEADVPLGAFLSGGIDSSLVVALMQAQSTERVRTFTIGFREGAFDEAPQARAVAEHLGTQHTELYISPQEAQAVIPQLPTVYDEPFADSSQIPTLLVAGLARSAVTVSLSGDGGDELFGGYSRYLLLDALLRHQNRLPAPVREALAATALGVPTSLWNGLLRPLRPVLPPRLRRDDPGQSLHRLGRALRRRDPDQLYLDMLSIWHDPQAAVRDGAEPTTVLSAPDDSFADWPASSQAMVKDSVTYLPDDILTKVDRATMSVGLEARAPLLDHNLYEFVWTLPRAHLVHRDRGKMALRRVLHRYVPAHMVERPKMGFGVPIGDWLRGPLRPWAEELLSATRLLDEGLLNPQPVREAWQEHLARNSDASSRLWVILMLEAWMDAQRVAVV